MGPDAGSVEGDSGDGPPPLTSPRSGRTGKVRLRPGVALETTIERGAVLRVRPILMTVTAIIAGLMPILWSHGTGASVMQRIAAPMSGGMVTATALTLIVIPVLYCWWRRGKTGSSHTDRRRARDLIP